MRDAPLEVLRPVDAVGARDFVAGFLMVWPLEVLQARLLGMFRSLALGPGELELEETALFMDQLINLAESARILWGEEGMGNAGEVRHG